MDEMLTEVLEYLERSDHWAAKVDNHLDPSTEPARNLDDCRRNIAQARQLIEEHVQEGLAEDLNPSDD